jgi:catechol 2,3-dioxygenase-like lactoylglutathione lyase family enzyme
VTIALTGLLHVKVPVTDVERSARWYTRVFDLELMYEFCELGTVRGVVLFHRSGNFSIALRDREAIPGRPLLDRFDLFSVSVEEREVLAQLLRRCQDMGTPHGQLEDRPDGTVLDIPDPDGTIVRCYHYTWDHDRFTGVAFGDDGLSELYDSPKIDLS